uniref:Uncharacterized protein n=1 Tax=Amazona collaria TaxID=241587 RepID=A0A8B9FZQ7_9PSIT
MLKKKWQRAICRDGITRRRAHGLPPAPALPGAPCQPSHGLGLPVPGRSWPGSVGMAGGDGDGGCGAGRVPSHSPVLMTFWMALATCPLSRELRSLTRRMRHVQSTTRDPASSTSPTARSGSGVSVKRCSPGTQPPSKGQPPAWERHPWGHHS